MSIDNKIGFVRLARGEIVQVATKKTKFKMKIVRVKWVKWGKRREGKTM